MEVEENLDEGEEEVKTQSEPEEVKLGYLDF